MTAGPVSHLTGVEAAGADISIMENITQAELDALLKEPGKQYANQFELVNVVIDGRTYHKAAHKESGLGMWSHDVAIEEAKRKKVS